MEDGELKKEIRRGVNEGGEEEIAAKQGSICGFESLHSLLQSSLKPETFQVVLT